MKKEIIAALLIFFLIFSTSAQVDLQFGNIDAIMMNQGASKVFRNSKNNQRKIEGTPYNQQMFAIAKVENVTQKYYMRYNVYDDEFEFITPKNDTLILDRINDFSNITFTGTNKKYVLLDYTNSLGKLVKGYLIDLYSKGNYTLYSKEKVTYYDGKIAKTSLEKEMPPRFVKSENEYYFKNKENIITEFPDSKKKLIKLFPDQKSNIETFIKDNKIDFDLDSDKKRIVDFLSSM
jgi:hypothetical protein